MLSIRNTHGRILKKGAPMNKLTLNISFILSILFSPLTIAAPITENIATVYITYEEQDTSSSATISFHGLKKSAVAEVYYDEVPHYGVVENYKSKALGYANELHKISHRTVYTTKLNNLKPNTKYYFTTGNPENAYTSEFYFRTLPSGDEAIRLVQGGDMGPDSIIQDISAGAMLSEPDIILIGGDIAYANGDYKKFDRWEKWFDNMNGIMLRPDKRVVPLIVAIGNHETRIGVGKARFRAPYFFDFFPQNGNKSYFLRKLGTHTTLFVLDTGHAYEHNLKQLSWLKRNLKKQKDVRNKIAMYHIPMYPVHRSYNDITTAVGRKFWLPQFDKYELDLAFENHDHAFKRTKLLRKGKVVASEGILFVGDGCWGRKIRSTSDKWYIEKHASVKHVWRADLSHHGISLEASGENYEIFDQLFLPAWPRVVVE
jgi:acid phosphatase type 7